MRLLLDTHIWIWSHLDPDRLSTRVARHLRDDGNELWLSPISAWETMILAERGRLALEPDPCQWIQHTLDSDPVREAPLSHDIVLASAATGLKHRDPADQFLVATAIVLGLTLVTADDRILAHAKVKTLRN